MILAFLTNTFFMCKHRIGVCLFVLFLYSSTVSVVFAADAALTALSSPARPFVAGVQPLTYTLKNNGNQVLTNVSLTWGLLGEQQLLSVSNWNGSLSPGQSTDVTVGNFNFGTDIAYELTAFISAANGAIDTNHSNDTLNTYNIAAGMPGGVYTIGGLNPSYPSLNVAVGLLNGGGVFGPVTFLLRDGTYNEQIYLNNFAGTGEYHPVVFRSESSNADNVVVQSDGTSVITINGADYVTFKQMTIKLSNTETSNEENGNAILMRGLNSHIYIENCKIHGLPTAPYTIGAGILVDEGSDNLHIKNSSLRYFGTDVGFNIYTNFQNEAPVIKNCAFGSEGQYGILARNVNNLNIVQCDFQPKSKQPILLENCTGQISLSQNSIQQTTETGLMMLGCSSASSNGLIANNYIKTTGGNPVVMTNCSGLKLYYNTIRLENATAARFALRIDSSDNIAAKNNIFYASGASNLGGAVRLNQAFDFDYNDFYTTAGFRTMLGATTYNNLNAWQTATQNDEHSLSVDPMFQDPSHFITTTALDCKPLVITSISIDLDGDPRDAITPDIGADEFGVASTTNADLQLLSVIATPSACNLPSNQVISVNIKNNGESAVHTFVLIYNINGNNGVSEIYNGDSIQVGQTITYNFNQTADFSADGTYLISVLASINGDINLSNNATSTSVMNYVSPTANISASPNTVACPGTTVVLTASGGGSYIWSTNLSASSITLSPTTTATYTVTVFAATGCSSTVSQTITIVSGVSWYFDADNDTYGNPDIDSVSCDLPTGYVGNLFDCNDDLAEINPEATELCDNIDNNCNGIIDDNIVVTSCPIPTNVSVDNIGTSSAKLQWQESGCVAYIRINWRKIGANTWQLAFSDSSSLFISDLLPNTTYEYKIRSFCGGIWNSEFTPVSTFTTLAQAQQPQQNKTLIFIVPNPMSDFVTVSMHQLKSGTCYVRLLGLFGQLLDEQKTEVDLNGSISVQFDMSPLPSGIYSFQVELPNGRVFAQNCFNH